MAVHRVVAVMSISYRIALMFDHMWDKCPTICPTFMLQFGADIGVQQPDGTGLADLACDVSLGLEPVQVTLHSGAPNKAACADLAQAGRKAMFSDELAEETIDFLGHLLLGLLRL